MHAPADRTSGSAASELLPIAAWWGGFLAGPLLGLVAFLSEPRGSLSSSHGAAAAVFWSAVLVVWVPLSGWIILFSGADPIVLVYVLPAVLLITVGACTYGTIQVRRGRTSLGRLPTA